jgi:hypothetical protein
MPRYKSLIAPAAIALGAVLALSGCGVIGGPEKLDPEKSPLAEYMSAFYGSQDQEFYNKQAVEVEKLVAECMADEGFEYIPVDQSQNFSTGNYMDQDRDTEEWVAQYGYAANLTPEESEEMWGGSTGEYVDPNQDYVQSLSESEMTAYYEVLYGAPQTDQEMNEDGSYEYNWEDGGCYGVSQHEVSGEQAYDQDQFKPIFDAMGKLYEDQAKDPRMKELEAKWASCMADAGYTFKAKQDAAQSVYDQQNEFWENNPNGDSPTDEQTKKWREDEIEVALADFKCGEKVDYVQQQLTVQFELEKQFIIDHKAELDELVAFQEKNTK